MKNITLLFTFLLISLTAAAQDYPHKRPDLLMGKTVTVVPNFDSEHLKYFSGFNTKMASSNPYMPKTPNSMDTPVDALMGKSFVVKDIKPSNTKGSSWLELEGTGADKLKLYYHYTPREMDYPFKVQGGLTYPSDFYCDYIEPGALTDVETLVAMLGNGKMLMKRKQKEGDDYSLTITEFIKGEVKVGDGAALILDNGKQLAFPTMPVLPTYSSANTYRYQVTFLFNPQQLDVLSRQKVVGVKILDHVVKVEESDKIFNVLKCLKTK